MTAEYLQDRLAPVETIHQRIKRFRQAKGLTIEAVAKEVGVSYQSAQQWEREPGGTAPSRKRLERVAGVLGVTPQEILTGSPAAHVARQEAPEYGDPQARELAALFYWLTDPEKEAVMMDVRSKAIANRAFLKRMQGKLAPPTDGHVAAALGSIPKKAKR